MSQSKQHEIPALNPYDEFNQQLAANVHPQNWENPEPKEAYHLVVIGAGTAGLVTAAGAAGLGARVALIERELMGGDCLNVGCVPSKAIIGAARKAAAVQAATATNEDADFGIKVIGDVDVNFEQVMRRLRRQRSRISPVDSAVRFADLGVDVFFGQGSFFDNDTIEVKTAKGEVSNLKFRKAVIASGGRASAPPISGLDSVKYLTNENLFSLTQLPKRFGVVGSGPIGSEMAQSFAQLGSEVFLFEIQDQILVREDVDAAKIVQSRMEKDGVNLILGATKMQIEKVGGKEVRIKVQQSGQVSEFDVDELLIAVGRSPNIDGLNLDAVGVKHHRDGIEVDDFLKTTNPRIFAAGDVCSRYQFTHAADFMARIVIQNALFALGPFGRKKVSDLVIPWATYTSPEIASVGISEQEAKSQKIGIDLYVQKFEHLDRAILEGGEDGFVKILTAKGTDKILGATIVAENAGDLVSEITVAMNNGVGLSGIGGTIHPYPTIAESIRKLGDQFNKTRLTVTNKKALNVLKWFNVGR